MKTFKIAVTYYPAPDVKKSQNIMHILETLTLENNDRFC